MVHIRVFTFFDYIWSLAELISYRVAILAGTFGRVATRFLLLYGSTLSQMQIMQVMYSMGTAAEDGEFIEEETKAMLPGL